MQEKRPFYKKMWFLIPLAVIIILVSAVGLYVHLSYLTALEVPEGQLSAMLPNLENEYGTVVTNSEECLVLELRAITKGELEDYFELFGESAFRTPVSIQDTCYVATNEDDYTLSVNYCPGEWRMYVSVWAPSFLPDISYEAIRGENAVNSVIVSNLSLPNSDKNGYPIAWESSDTGVISADGVVSRPKSGVEVVNVTATLQATNEKKIFTFRVPGVEVDKHILIVENDTNPAANPGVTPEDALFTWDKSNNSIIYDLGKVKKVNYAIMQDDDGLTRMYLPETSLWVSNDNVTYTRIEDFKMIQSGRKWYLHDFETECRYVKVHYNIYDFMYGYFTGNVSEMLIAGYEENVGGNGAKFKTSEYVLTNNTGEDRRDYAFCISKEDMGITGSDNSVRIYLDGKLQYFYIDGQNVYVRIRDLAQGASVTLQVKQSKSDNVLNLADKESVYEVVYGTREMWTNHLASEGRNVFFLEKGTKFPNGSVLEQDTLFSTKYGVLVQSTDGGYTWQDRAPMENNAPEGGIPIPYIHFIRGYIHDTYTNRLFAHLYVLPDPIKDENGVERRLIKTYIYYSDDGGLTWGETNHLPYDDQDLDKLQWCSCIYGDGLAVSSHDGTGPNVDLVIHMGCAGYGDNGECCSRVAYSRDGGITWEYSESILRLLDIPGEECGLSEATIMERDDGVLVNLIRIQTLEAYTFAISYSTDFGVTWTAPGASDIYTGPTQPISDQFIINGEDVDMLSWSGNHCLGFKNYIRTPLNFANTTNGETYRNIQNSMFRSVFEVNEMGRKFFVTNHSAERIDDGDLYVGWNDSGEQNIFMRFTNFDDWYTRTKGGYDSFENGIAAYEGWFAYVGSVDTSWNYATDGKCSMHLKKVYTVARSVPYLQEGRISLNVYASEKTNFVLELQSAFNPQKYSHTMPVGVEIRDNEVIFEGAEAVSGLKLNPGWNQLVIDINLLEGRATFSLNGSDALDMPINPDAFNYVTYITIMGRSEIFVDEVMITSENVPVLSAAAGDKEAADTVIAMIQTMGQDKTKIESAWNAYSALNQVQKDFVNRPVVYEDAFVNYYDLLVQAKKNAS